MSGRTFKRCGCRDEGGNQLGSRCTRLGQKNHGAWAFVVDVRGKDGKRKQHKRSGFRTKAAAVEALEQVVGLSRSGTSLDDKLTLGAWLDRWLDEKATDSGISSAGRTIRTSTQVGYRQQVRDYLKPKLGQIPLSQLSAEDISRAYRAITVEATAKAKAAAERGGSTRIRVAGPTTLRRVHACLRAALNVAVKNRLLLHNPALGVDLPAAARTEIRPWQAAELGQFLDYVQSHRLSALFEVLAACGLRRGEALGLAWSDIDFEHATLTVRRQLLNAWRDGAPVFGPPKSSSGQRQVELDSHTLGSLLAHKLGQDTERDRWRGAYEDQGLVFAQENGRPYDPSKISKVFAELVAATGLPRIRLHDLRHGSASLMLAAGVPVEIVSKRLGHSSIGVTMDTYSHLLEGVGRQAAERAMGLVPRQSRPELTNPR